MPNKEDLANEAKVAQLKQLAKDNDVDLDGASTKSEIVEKIVASRKVTKEDLENILSDDEDETETSTPQVEESDVSPTGVKNVAGSANSQLDLAPPMKEEHGTSIPHPNLRQPVIDEAMPTGSASTEGLDPNLTDPDKVAAERAEGRTSDAATRDASVTADEVPPDLNVGEKPSDAGPEQYPFPPQGDVEVATVDPGDGKGEYLLPLEVEDWVILDGAHELVPDRLDGRRAVVLDAPRYLTPQDKKDDVWIRVRTRDEVNATLTIPLAAVREVQKGGVSHAR